MPPTPSTPFLDGLTMPDRDNPNFELCKENLRRLREARDAKGRKFEIIEMPIFEKLHPERKIVPVPSTAMAVDGGGVGCVTQQQPAGETLQ